MTDYYAVLKRAVGGLEHEAGDVRRAVYDKARAALIGQLKSIDPPLTTAEISRQRLELEEAIRKVEREAAVTAAGPSPARARAAAAVADAMSSQATDPSLARREGQSPLRSPATPRSMQTPTAPPRSAPPIRVLPDANAPISARAGQAEPGPTPRIEPGDQPSYRQPSTVNKPVARQEPTRSPQWSPQVDPQDAPRSAQRPGRRDNRDEAPAFEREPRFADEPAFDAPRQDAPDYAEDPSWPKDPTWSQEPLEGAGPSADVVADEPRQRSRKARPIQSEASYLEQARPSPWPTRILILVILLILLGIAALAWSQRATLSQYAGGLFAKSPSTSQSTSTTPSADSSASKNSDRLGDAAQPEEAPKSVRTVDAVPPPEGAEGDPLSGVVQPEGTTAAQPEAAAPVAAAPSADSATAPAAQPATPPGTVDASEDALVAQKAILYEQPSGGGSNVTALKATVLWKFEPNSSNGPEIQAQIDVPDRKMKVTVNIRKNSDPALPASHLVEVIADTPAEFPGGGIKSVPAFVMKPTEEARGQPLDGAAAKVADGYFWIAFANEAGPMAQNIALLKERNWIDIPLVYNNDQRAILTLEKGTPGQRVFEKALAAWGN